MDNNNNDKIINIKSLLQNKLVADSKQTVINGFELFSSLNAKQQRDLSAFFAQRILIELNMGLQQGNFSDKMIEEYKKINNGLNYFDLIHKEYQEFIRWMVEDVVKNEK